MGQEEIKQVIDIWDFSKRYDDSIKEEIKKYILIKNKYDKGFISKSKDKKKLPSNKHYTDEKQLTNDKEGHKDLIKKTLLLTKIIKEHNNENTKNKDRYKTAYKNLSKEDKDTIKESYKYNDEEDKSQPYNFKRLPNNIQTLNKNIEDYKKIFNFVDEEDVEDVEDVEDDKKDDKEDGKEGDVKPLADQKEEDERVTVTFLEEQKKKEEFQKQQALLEIKKEQEERESVGANLRGENLRGGEDNKDITKEDPTHILNGGIGNSGNNIEAEVLADGKIIDNNKDNNELSRQNINYDGKDQEPTAPPTNNVGEKEEEIIEEDKIPDDNVGINLEKPEEPKETESTQEGVGDNIRMNVEKPIKNNTLVGVDRNPETKERYDTLVPREDLENNLNLNSVINKGVNILKENAKKLSIEKMKLGIMSFHEIYNNEIDIFRDKEHQKEKDMALKSSNLEVVRSHFLKMEMIIKNYLSSLGGDLSIGVIISADDFKNHFNGGGSKEEINYITNENNYITNNDNNDDILNETIKENPPKDDEDDFRKDNLGKGQKDDINKPKRRLLDNEKIEGNTHFSNDVRFKKNEMNHITSLKGHSPFNNPTTTSILVRQGGIRHRFSKGISGKKIQSFDSIQGIGNIDNPSLRQDNKNANYIRSNIIRRNPPNFIINS